MRTILIYISLILLIINCFDTNTSDTQKQTALVSLVLTQNNSDLYKACHTFYETESSCTTTPTSISTTCSTTEMNRLKGGISPAASQTDAILTEYYKCWSICNSTFNSDSKCLSNQFSSQESYRAAQRITTTYESQKWEYCFTKCNDGQSDFTLLSGTTYPVDLMK